MNLAMKFLAFLPAAISAGYASGCGSTTTSVPIELIHARQAFMRADSGPAPMVTPGHMRSAKESLDAAESAFRSSPQASATLDLAYIAARKSEIAEAVAGRVLAQRRKAEAARELDADLEFSPGEPEIAEGAR